MANDATNEQTASRSTSENRKKRQLVIWSGVCGALALSTIVLAITLAGNSNVHTASNFPITLYQGDDELGARNLELRDLRDKPVVLNFWAGLCPPCRAEMPDLQLFHDEFKDRVTLIGIDLGQHTGLGSQTDARNLLNHLVITYPAGFTEDDNIVRDYEVLGIPTTLFINSKGEIFRQWAGLLTLEVLSDLSSQMLALESSSLK